MKQLFSIGDSTAAGMAADRLWLRIGDNWAAFAYTDEQAAKLLELGYFSVRQWTKEELTWLHDRLFRPAAKVQIGLDHSCGMLLPAGVPGSVMNMINERREDHTWVQEPVNGWQMNTVFSISTLLQQWVNENFPEAGTVHQHTAMMKFVPSSPENGVIYLDIRPSDLHMLVAARGQLLLSQHYDYTGPEDVLFYLLRACQQFGLGQETIALKISGLIDKESVLYKELYQYFLRIELREPSWQLPAGELPAHYFTSLNDLFLCVS